MKLAIRTPFAPQSVPHVSIPFKSIGTKVRRPPSSLGAALESAIVGSHDLAFQRPKVIGDAAASLRRLRKALLATNPYSTLQNRI